MAIKVALPKGRLLKETADLLKQAAWGLSDYHEDMRLYRLRSRRFPQLQAKVFNERDVPIQVAVGNYDLGICGLAWIEELLARYPASALVKIRSLGYGEDTLHAVVSRSLGVVSPEELAARPGVIRIATEYPNLGEALALKLRLRRFSVFPLWGAAIAYPPESADLALVSGRVDDFHAAGLRPIGRVIDSSAFLIANKRVWETKDVGELVTSICEQPVVSKPPLPDKAPVPEMPGELPAVEYAEGMLRLALPDGHQQSPTVELLSKAGIQIDDYPSPVGNCRPKIGLPGVAVKVIRPQDMPLQVANGNFDLAVSGRDWLGEHLAQFPSSSVRELLDLKFGWVRIVAVVSNELSVSDIDGLRRYSAGRSVPLRVASEYTNTADKYARDNHLGRYLIIPTWGASEAFLPEDADLLIENTQTGRTLAKNKLKIIDTLSESTACLIGNTDSISSTGIAPQVEAIIDTLRRAVEEN